MGKMMSPNTTIWWVPLAGLTTPAAPKATEINAGTNISAAIETGYSLKFNDSDVDNSKTIVDEGNVETPTLQNYEGNLTFFKDEIGGGTQDAPVPSTVFTAANALFKVAKVEGWLVSRQGKKAALAAAATDIVSVFRFISDYPKTIDGEAGNPIKTSVEFLPQGEAYANVAAVA